MKVQLLAFNDFHGNIEPPSGSNGKITLPGNMSVNAGGAAFFANHIASLRAANPNTVVCIQAVRSVTSTSCID